MYLIPCKQTGPSVKKFEFLYLRRRCPPLWFSWKRKIFLQNFLFFLFAFFFSLYLCILAKLSLYFFDFSIIWMRFWFLFWVLLLRFWFRDFYWSWLVRKAPWVLYFILNEITLMHFWRVKFVNMFTEFNCDQMAPWVLQFIFNEIKVLQCSFWRWSSSTCLGRPT